MAISKVADRATVNGNAAVTTVDLVLTGMTVGNMLIIRTAADNSGGGGAARSVTVTNQSGTPIDTATDVAFQQNNDPGAASAGITLNVILAEITATSGTVRLTYSGSVVQAAIAEEWSGIGPIATAVVGTPVGANGTNSTNLGSATDASVASGNLAYGAVAIEGPASDTFTQDADTTNGSWSSLTKAGTSNATATDNVTIAGGYKEATATGAQTYNPTNNNARDSATLILELAAGPVAVGLSIDLRWNVATGAYISEWAHSTDSADGTSHTVNLPAHAIGDRLVAFISYDLDGSAESVQTPTDFTHVTSILPTGSLTRQELKERRSVTGSEAWFGQSSFTFTTSYSTQICVSIACVKNHDPNQALATATASLASGSSANVGSVSIPWTGDSLILLSVTNSDKATVSSTPAGYTSNGQIQSGGAGADAASLWTGSKTTSAATEDPAAVVLSTAVSWTGVVVAIREVQTIVGKSIELLWDVEVITPVGKTFDTRWDTQHNVGRLALLRGRQNSSYNWNQVQIPRDNPATSWDGAYQYVSWVDPDRHYVIAKRRHGSDFGSAPVDLYDQTPTALNALAELDNHNYVSIGVDTDGYIHLAGGMHAGGGGPDDALRYMRSVSPNDISLWTVPGGGLGSMVGTDETMVTYPQFVNLADGTLLFFYRSGESGIGDWLINEYDTTTQTWSRVGTIWLSGISDGVSAYPTIAIDRRQGTLGRIHSFWTWREDQGGAESNRYVCYGYSDDGGATWKKSDDTSYTLPITEATSEVVIDPALTATGKILNNPSTGFDQAGDPLCVVLIETATPNLREYHHLYLSAGVWQDYNTGITGGGRPPIVKFDSGTVWALVRTTSASLGGGVAAIDLTTPGSHTTKVLWAGDSLQAEWTLDSLALDLRDEIHTIVGPTRSTGVQAGDSGELAQYPATAVFIAAEDDQVLNAVVHRRGPATFQEKTTASSWQITPGFAAAIDETVVVALTHSPQTLSSIADSKGNTWQAAAAAPNASGSDLRVWYSKLTVALTSTDTITFTWAGNTTDRSVVVDVFAGIDPTTPVAATDTDTGSSTTPSSQVAATVEGTLIYAAVGVEGPQGDTFTEAPDADTAWSVPARVGTTGSTDDTNSTTARQWAIVDGVPVTRVFAPTLGTSRDWSTVVVAFNVEAVEITLTGVADTANGNTADAAGALTQAHTLSGVADTANGNTTDNVTVTTGGGGGGTASIVNQAGSGGHPGAGQSNYTTAWSLTAGNLIVVAEMTRSRSGAPTITNCSDEADVAQTSADTNGVTAHLFIGTVDADGTVTYTPTQSGADRWTVVIAEIADATFLDAAGVHEGPFDSSISLTSDAMSGNGGLAFFSSQSDADGAIDLTAPTVLFENAPSGFMLSNAAAWEALDATETSTMTGSIPGGGVNVHHDFWALFESTGGAGGDTLAVDDTANGNTTENVTLTQAHTLAGVADTANGNTAENVVLESWAYITDLSDWATAGSVSRWVKMAPAGSHTTGRPMHINNADDVDGSDDVLAPDDVVYSTGVLWIAAGAQNYGGTNLRLNQPIDLTAQRTIKLGVSLDAQNFLNGWLELVVTDKPYAGAAWSDSDNADGATPRYGFVVKLNYTQVFTDPGFHPSAGLDVWDEWVQTSYDPDDTALEFTVGSIHVVQITFDDTSISATVDGAAWWSDSWTLPSELLTSEAWVHIGVHNHATLKYTPYPDAIVTRWNQLGWDGPTPTPPTIHRVPDDYVSHTMAVHSPPGTGTDGGSGPGVDGAWTVPTGVLTVAGVPAIVDRAILVFTLQTSTASDPSTTTVSYELNGAGSHNAAAINSQIPGGGRNFYIVEDIDPAELVAGDNDIEIAVTAPGGGATPHVANVELLVWEGDTATLVVADTANGNTADAVGLTQAHTLAGIADTENANTADAVALTQAHTLAGLADTENDNTADAVALTQAHVLSGVADTENGNTADATTLTQDQVIAGVADTANANTADTVTLTQAHTLTVADTANTNTADTVALTQAHTLAGLADTANGNTADAVVLTQAHLLVVADTANGNTTENVVLNFAVALVVADTANGNTTDAVVLTQAHTLVVADTANANTTDTLALTQAHTLAGLADTANGNTADSVTLSLPADVEFNMCFTVGAPVFVTHLAAVAMVARAATIMLRVRTAGSPDTVDRSASHRLRTRVAGSAEFQDREAGASVIQDRSATISFVHGQPEHTLEC